MKKIIVAFSAFLLVLAGCTTEEEKIDRKVEELHAKILTVDTHCDTPMRLTRSGFQLGKRSDEGCVDFVRMKEGGLDAEFFAVFLGQGARDEETTNAVYNQALTIFDSIHANLDRYSDIAGLATSVEDAYRLKSEGKIAAFIGVENGYPIGQDISRIKEFYDRGARYITLSHSSNNDICDSSTDKKGPEHHGVSNFGAEVIKEMNRLGMMIDVSHISDESFYDVIAISRTPVIASHSSARAICNHPRNFSDDMLRALRSNEGVIQICILSDYIKTPEANPEFNEKYSELMNKWREMGQLSEEQRTQRSKEMWDLRVQYGQIANVSDAVDHIQHVIDVIGVDYVGIGSDFDGGGQLDGCKSADEMKNITREMVKRGFSDEDIQKIWGGNFMRVMKAVEEAKR